MPFLLCQIGHGAGGASATECNQLCPQRLPTILAAGSNLHGRLREPLPLRPRTFNTRCALSFLIGCKINILCYESSAQTNNVRCANLRGVLREPPPLRAQTIATARANLHVPVREPSRCVARTFYNIHVHGCTQLYTAVHSSRQLHTAVHSCTQLYTAVHSCTQL